MGGENVLSPNYAEIMRYIDILHPLELFECRAIGYKTTYNGGKKQITLSGYFTDPAKLIEEMKKYEEEKGLQWYISLNQIDKACYSREQRDKLIENVKNSTSDEEITAYKYILVDVDVEKKTGISSSDEEVAEAKEALKSVYLFLMGMGFAKPLLAFSGNGFHAIYKTHIPLTDENRTEVTDTIKRFLKVLNKYCGSAKAHPDEVTFNPARITKLIGSVARKGSDTKERPHRLSKIEYVPEPFVETPFALFQKVASEWKDPVPQRTQQYSVRKYGTFDAEQFLTAHGVHIAKKLPYADGTKLVLEECPFNSQHKAPDSMVFVGADGRVGFRCLHAHCADKKWQDVRELFEPGYREDRFRASTDTARNRVADAQTQEPQKPVEQTEEHFQSMSKIKPYVREKVVCIPTGVAELDKSILGLNKGEVSILSGSNASGKSTLLSQLILEFTDKNFNTAVFSGELTSGRMKNWLYLQAAGQAGVMPSPNGVTYTVKSDVVEAIDRWMGDKVWLYNNDYGSKATPLMQDFERHLQKHATDIVVLDNLMAMSGGTGMNKYDWQSEFVQKLSTMAKKFNVHILFVCHPRKSVTLLRKTDISGSADLANAADNVFIIHRCNDDFYKAASEYWGAKKASAIMKYTNVIEICKNRDIGIVDKLCGLYYDPASKQLQNEVGLQRAYGWRDDVKVSTCPF